jgi:alpha-beta hydrolase superfamily lysophospholipase
MLRDSAAARGIVGFAGLIPRAAAAAVMLLLLCHCAASRAHRNTPAMHSDPNSWTARDGKVLPFKHWPGEPKQPRAVIICVHGLSGAASDFWPVGERFPADGIAVFAVQLRGQGNDPDLRRRGDIRSSAQWRDDLLDFTALVRRRYPNTPVFWFGESLGALIAIDTAASRGGAPEGVGGIILTSPVVGLHPRLRLPFLKNLAVRTLLRLRPGKRISLEDMSNSDVRVTSATTHREQMEKTEHYVKDFTLRLFRQVERLIRGSGAAARLIRVPVLTFYTPNDPLTPREDVERFMAALASADKEAVFFPESYHLILHDRNREDALRLIRDWLGRRRPAK